MRRRSILALLGSVAITAPEGLLAQQPAKSARIGVLWSNRTTTPHLAKAFGGGLRDLGYVEGRNVTIEHRDAASQIASFPALAAELVALNVDVIVTASTAGALAAQKATKIIPIVFATVPDPIGSGLVASLARPGGNITGLSNLGADLVGKCFELLTQTVPTARRIAVLWQPGAFGERTEQDMLNSARAAAQLRGVQPVFVEARIPADIELAFDKAITERADAMNVLTGGMMFSERRRIVDLAARQSLPTVYQYREAADIGGLMAYGASFADLFRRAASYADKIIRGARPSDLAVEQPTKFETIINLKTAMSLSLAIPQLVIAQADEVIE
jgi:putative ABC transport system substrate-binding protein